MRSVHLVQGFMMASWSISWKTWRPLRPIGLEPPTATTGQQSISALAMPVVRLITPGPLAAMHTLGFCNSRL